MTNSSSKCLEWTERRARLSHDILMNTLFPCIAKLKRITAKEVEDEIFLRDFSSSFLAKWAAFQAAAIQLLNDFPEWMNPGGELGDSISGSMRDEFQRAATIVWDNRSRNWAHSIECSCALSEADACLRSFILSADNGVFGGPAVEAAWTQLENIQTHLAGMPKHLSWILPDGTLLELN